MKKLYVALFCIIAPVGLFLLLSWIFWVAEDSKTLSVYVLDKTVPTEERNEHRSFFWILNHQKIAKPDGNKYDYQSDYYGFYPMNGKSKEFDFKSIRITEIDEAADSYDMLYYTDTYGVYYNEWYRSTDSGTKRSSKVYGGLNQNDYLLLKAMKEKKKLILTEFNLYNAPTTGLIREKVETLFGISWSGWYGKYFTTLDTSKRNCVPHWIVKLYMEQNNNQWDFKNPGVVLVHKYGTIAVLEEGKHLKSAIPVLKTKSDVADKMKLPQELDYTNWFDISYSDERNEVISSFHLSPTPEGDSLLTSYKLEAVFPAISRHVEDYKFYYLGGNFAHNDINMAKSYFDWIEAINNKRLSPDSKNKNKFFWKFYYPLMDHLLNDYITDQN